MANLKIVLNASADRSRELDKRFYVPGYIVEATCPECAEVRRVDLARDYLSYPVVGEPKAVGFACGNDHEWTEHVIVRVSVEAAPAVP